MAMTTFTPPNAAPTPPAGPTTYTALTGMVVGVIIAALSLFDVVPSGEDVQALGTITGAAIALVAFVVSAISRTKQANNLAKIAQDAREHAVEWAAAKQTVEQIHADDPNVNTEAHTLLPSSDEIVAWDRVTEMAPEVAPLGAPVDKSLEVPGGGVRPPGVDVGGEAPAPDEPVIVDLGSSGPHVIGADGSATPVKP